MFLLIDRLVRRVLGDADARQRAVEDLDLISSGTGRRLDHVVGVTRRVFGTEIAWFTVVDDDRLVHIARAGTNLIELPLADSFSSIAIGYREGMVIPDARQDPRFLTNPLVVGSERIRFYAGYPVESPGGERVGMLCALDREPRVAEDVDLSLLREMAHLVEQQLWPAR